MFCGARPCGRPRPNSMPFKYRDLTSKAPRMAFLSPALWLVTGETSTTPKPHSQFKVRTLVSLLVRFRVIGQSNNSDLPSMVTRIVVSSPCPVTQLKNIFKRVLRQTRLWLVTSGFERRHCRAHCCAVSSQCCRFSVAINSFHGGLREFLQVFTSGCKLFRILRTEDF